MREIFKSPTTAFDPVRRRSHVVDIALTWSSILQQERVDVMSTNPCLQAVVEAPWYEGERLWPWSVADNKPVLVHF
ncbi:MAG: hypothetical protein V7L02_06765 [Nostoc sp.]|uniref:hypothetical protein n=1 Tax=unclassified Nostoc TaxID=2593658 RepID=UPI001DEC5C3C|nr:hypothetical protein [Nostoc sp. JL34]MBN3882765.1 hypothetical protein [Nostoc sp. JL34]